MGILIQLWCIFFIHVVMHTEGSNTLQANIFLVEEGLSRRTVIWGGGIDPRVVRGHSWIYMHILAIYMHICHIQAYTYIGLGMVYIHAYTCIFYVTDRVSLQGNIIHAYMFKYKNIHTFTCIYCVCS